MSATARAEYETVEGESSAHDTKLARAEAKADQTEAARIQAEADAKAAHAAAKKAETAVGKADTAAEKADVAAGKAEDVRVKAEDEAESKANTAAEVEAARIAKGMQPGDDPGDFNVPDVNKYFKTADDDEKQRILLAEEAGQGRLGILND
jgi:hypothetical protein